MSMTSYLGMPIIVDDKTMSKIIEDWSRVRSPGRARRRRRRHRQNIAYRVVPKEEIFSFGGKLVMHSVMLKKLEAEIAKQTRT